MRNQLRFAAPAILAGLIALLACGPSAATPTFPLQIGTLMAVTDTPVPLPASQGAGACEFDYFPTEEDTSWEYAGNNSATGSYQRTDVVSESRDDGFTMTSRFSDSDLTLALEYTCTEAGLIMLDPTQQFVSGTAMGPDGTGVMTTLGHSGITLPAGIEAGQTWQQYVEWVASSADVSFHGEFTFDYTATGLESITVPYGTFDAMHVETELRGRLEEDLGDRQISSWFAKDVGMIKQDFVCDLLGGKIDNFVELSGYDSP
jgi:hypothetical protein